MVINKLMTGHQSEQNKLETLQLQRGWLDQPPYSKRLNVEDEEESLYEPEIVNNFKVQCFPDRGMSSKKP